MNVAEKSVLFNVSGQHGWMNSHAQVPTVLKLKDRNRVYFSTRSTQNESRVARVDFSLDWTTVIELSKEPLLALGRAGTFDEHGNMPSAVLKQSDKVLLYYSGWSRRTATPYANYTGLAVSYDEGKTFEKFSEGPVLSQDIYDPFSATSPCVFFENGQFHCFYCSGTGWLEISNKYEHVYDIKYAVSSDGVHWNKTGNSIVKQNYPEEALTRPSLIQVNSTYYLFFCARGSDDFRDGINGYKIGVATSNDLHNWVRRDSWLDIPTDNFDKNMQAYPCVFIQNDKIRMLYNGNGFGQTGFAIADILI